jgi:uncharacterized protein (DUF2249 family)
MNTTSPRHARGEVSTGSAVESAGRLPAVSCQEGVLMGVGMVPPELVERWQAVYSEYVAVDQMQRGSSVYPVQMARLSAGVAAAWRDLGAVPGLPWWAVAALTTSAEAYERQARSWAHSPTAAGRPSERESGPRPQQSAGSAGQLLAVSGQESAVANWDMVPPERVDRWQAVYSEYTAMDRMERVEQVSPHYPVQMARLSAEVAAAWRHLGAVPRLPWWMVAALTNAAEAYEGQARSWALTRAGSGRPTERENRPGPQQGEPRRGGGR